MKKIFFYTLVMLIGISMNAQRPDGDFPGTERNREGLESMKIGYLTKKLKLTPDESKAFWPVYDKYQVELRELRENHKPKKNREDWTEETARLYLDQDYEFRKRELELEKDKMNELMDVISVIKVAKLHQAELSFRREMLNSLRKRKDRRQKMRAN